MYRFRKGILRCKKEFKFNTRTDYIFYLSELIIDLSQKVERLEKYKLEIEQIIIAPQEQLIQRDIYEGMSDKIV